MVSFNPRASRVQTYTSKKPVAQTTATKYIRKLRRTRFSFHFVWLVTLESLRLRATQRFCPILHCFSARNVKGVVVGSSNSVLDKFVPAESVRVDIYDEKSLTNSCWRVDNLLLN